MFLNFSVFKLYFMPCATYDINVKIHNFIRKPITFSILTLFLNHLSLNKLFLSVD